MTKVLSVIHSGITDVSKIGSRKYIGGVELVKNRKIVPEKKKVFGNALVSFVDGSG